MTNIRLGSATPPRPFTLPFLDARRDTPTVTTFRFGLDGRGFRFLPNQFVALQLDQVEDPWGPVRRFSLSSSPTEEGFISITTKMKGSPFKERLLSLKSGEEAHVLGPLGNFVLDATRPAVMLAGGIGISPFRGMIRYAADRGLAIAIVLLYSNRVPEEITFRAEFDELSRRWDNLRVIHTITRPQEAQVSWQGRVGRIDAALIQEATKGLEKPVYYICGLPAMVEDMANLLYRGLAVPAADIRLEKFMGY